MLEVRRRGGSAAGFGRANRQFGLLRRGDAIAVGVSGGKDSAALLFALKKFADKIGEITLKPVLVDEGIDGYRNRAAECAEKLCSRLGLQLHTISYEQAFGLTMDSVMKKRELAKKVHRSCSYCGVFRKYCLNKASREVGANKLAIGHNADDVAQTLLMNLMRGEPQRLEEFGVVTGSPSRELFVPRIRPLAYCLEMECAYYCVLNEIPFYRGGCPYAEESFRVEVKDFLNALEDRHPGTKNSLLKSFFELREKLLAGKAGGKTLAQKNEVENMLAEKIVGNEKRTGGAVGRSESTGSKIGEKSFFVEAGALGRQKIVLKQQQFFYCLSCGEYCSEESGKGVCRACELVSQLNEGR